LKAMNPPPCPINGLEWEDNGEEGWRVIAWEVKAREKAEGLMEGFQIRPFNEEEKRAEERLNCS